MSSRTQWLVVAILGVGVTFAAFRPAAGKAEPAAATTAGPKYTIVDTEGTNLLVVDNATNTLYYYTVDPGKEVGDDLKLRGTIDLKDVGKPVLKPVATK